MDIQMISFVLALVVAGLCFALVKHTADEFDRWYDEQSDPSLRIPPTVISLLVVCGAALLVSLVR